MKRSWRLRTFWGKPFFVRFTEATIRVCPDFEIFGSVEYFRGERRELFAIPPDTTTKDIRLWHDRMKTLNAM